MHFAVTDSHLHLWDSRTFNYPWLSNQPALSQSFLLTDLLIATKNLHIENFVYIQSDCEPSQALAEALWVAELAQRDARIHAIVAHALLEQGEAIRAHLAALKNIPLVHGVRRSLHAEADDFCVQQSFIDGVKSLAEFNFSFDICAKPQQLPAVIRLVEQCSNVKFILNHMGKPNIATKQFEPWAEHIKTLAAFPNVWCKISGLITEAHHQTWRSDDLKPYILHAIKEFSCDRVMFGSDWPILNLAGSYTHWAHTLHDLLNHHCTEEELKKIFYSNAKTCYALAKEIVEV